MKERLLKAREVAELLNVEVGTVLDYFERGELPGFRIGSRVGRPVRFRLSEVEAWVEAGRVNGHTSLDHVNAPGRGSERPGAEHQEAVTPDADFRLRLADD